ncbi:MAG: AAA family ATPase, partial [Alphaproteobacteria bacterium]|nr:AAA family ATPase [Alphaproteobacteria bacterium]
MNKYTQWLNLDFDPFAPSASSRDFYCSGHRQNLLDQIVEFSLYSNAMIAVTGPLGAGKTTLATNFCDRFADEAVCVKVAATLFMNQNQFVEALQSALGFKLRDSSDTNSSIEQICRYAAELDLEARSLILIIDDAHELSAEVLQLLTKLLDSSVDSSIHALLFGENQIDSLLQRILTADEQERLAIFPLDGFASEETQEYIRFKLATARFTKELPIDGGIVGVIHNSSRGMPGAINNLVADALNGAVPASEPDEFAGIGPIFSGASSEQAADRDEKTDLEQAWIASIQPRYWAATAALVVLLTGTLLFWDAGPRETQSIPITVAVTPGATQVIDVERLTELAAAVPALTAADAAVVAGVGEFPLTAAVAQGESNLAAVVIAEEVVAAETIAAVNNAAETTQTIAEVAVAEETAVITTTSSFVKRLLQASPGDYAVQLLASHSEASIIDFIAQLSGDHPAGYFETRYQSKPWFVAVLASFDDRNQATAAISSLPARLRSNEPWVRSVAGIQTDIR